MMVLPFLEPTECETKKKTAGRKATEKPERLEEEVRVEDLNLLESKLVRFFKVDFGEPMEKEVRFDGFENEDQAKSFFLGASFSFFDCDMPPEIFIRCGICVNWFTLKEKDFQFHLNEIHKKLHCDQCDRSYTFERALKKHKSQVHLSSEFKCMICSTSAGNKQNLRRHVKKCHDFDAELKADPSLKDFGEKLGHKCEHCDKILWSQNDRMTHVNNEHKNVKSVRCPLCPFVTSTKLSIKKHFKRLHPNDHHFEDVSVSCAICSKPYPNAVALAIHRKEVHGDEAEKPKAAFECSECSLTFTKHVSWKKHMKSRHGQKMTEYNCQTCGKSFTKLNGLKMHEKITHGKDEKESKEVGFKKGFKCKFCEDSFTTKQLRMAHYSTKHPNEDLFTCTTCGQGFKTKTKLFNHSQSHKDLLFECEVCSKSFKRRDSFKEHQLIHFGPRYKCPHCPKEFVQKSNLRRHVRIHLGIKPYPCNVCSKSFSDQGARSQHLITHAAVKYVRIILNIIPLVGFFY